MKVQILGKFYSFFETRNPRGPEEATPEPDPNSRVTPEPDRQPTFDTRLHHYFAAWLEVKVERTKILSQE